MIKYNIQLLLVLNRSITLHAQGSFKILDYTLFRTVAAQKRVFRVHLPAPTNSYHKHEQTIEV